MFDEFEKYLKEKISFTEEDFEMIKFHSQWKKIRKKQYLLQSGDVCKYNIFVSKGFLKLYNVDEKGQERILQFAPENYWTGDRASMTTGLPSKYNIDAVEDSDVILIERSDFEMLRKAIPVFNDFVSETSSKNVWALQERIHISITLSAKEKYLNFIQQFPEIANRIPLHMISSYLGISAETLSRIRSRSLRK